MSCADAGACFHAARQGFTCIGLAIVSITLFRILIMDLAMVIPTSAAVLGDTAVLAAAGCLPCMARGVIAMALAGQDVIAIFSFTSLGDLRHAG